jgi:hypothetical protein
MSRPVLKRLSLTLNVALAVTLVFVAAYRPNRPVPALPATEDVDPTETPTPFQMVLPTAPSRFNAAATESDQRRFIVDELRKMGVPNNVLARIVLADLDWNWNKRGGEVSLKCYGDPEILAALKMENAMALDSEMRAALGEEGFKLWDRENMQREANVGRIPLSPDETDLVYSYWKKLKQHELELRNSRIKGEIDDAGASDAYRVAAYEFEKEMKALLGEERFAQAQGIPNDAIAAALKSEMGKVAKTERQFEEVLAVQKQWNEQRLELEKRFQNDPSSPAYLEEMANLNAARDDEHRRVLGDAAFEALQKEQHPSYAVMKKHAELWGLNDQKIDSVYATMRYYEKSVHDYQIQAAALESRGERVDWAAVDRNLQQFAKQTSQALHTYLGADSFNKLQKNGVFDLQPPANPPELSQRAETIR